MFVSYAKHDLRLALFHKFSLLYKIMRLSKSLCIETKKSWLVEIEIVVRKWLELGANAFFINAIIKSRFAIN